MDQLEREAWRSLRLFCMHTLDPCFVQRKAWVMSILFLFFLFLGGRVLQATRYPFFSKQAGERVSEHYFSFFSNIKFRGSLVVRVRVDEHDSCDIRFYWYEQQR